MKKKSSQTIPRRARKVHPSKRIVPVLQAIANATNVNDKIELLSHLHPKTLNILASAIEKLINNKATNYRFSKEDNGRLKTALMPHKKEVKVFINSSVSDDKKRKLFKQNGGALGTIIAALAPLVISALMKLKK